MQIQKLKDPIKISTFFFNLYLNSVFIIKSVITLQSFIHLVIFRMGLSQSIEYTGNPDEDKKYIKKLIRQGLFRSDVYCYNVKSSNYTDAVWSAAQREVEYEERMQGDVPLVPLFIGSIALVMIYGILKTR